MASGFPVEQLRSGAGRVELAFYNLVEERLDLGVVELARAACGAGGPSPAPSPRCAGCAGGAPRACPPPGCARGARRSRLRARRRPRRATPPSSGPGPSSSAPARATGRSRISRTIVSVSGWSFLFTTITSGISITPALSAWIESPEPGISASTTVSAWSMMSTSAWPTPTVSRKTSSLPAASIRSAACSVASDRPPSEPRLAIERMKTPGSRKWSASRMRSPSSAPFVNGDDGSIESTATSRSRCARVLDERADDRRLADARRPREADHRGAAGVRVDAPHELPALGVVVLDQRDRARERTLVAREKRLGQLVGAASGRRHRRRSLGALGGRDCLGDGLQPQLLEHLELARRPARSAGRAARCRAAARAARRAAARPTGSACR